MMIKVFYKDLTETASKLVADTKKPGLKTVCRKIVKKFVQSGIAIGMFISTVIDYFEKSNFIEKASVIAKIDNHSLEQLNLDRTRIKTRFVPACEGKNDRKQFWLVYMVRLLDHINEGIVLKRSWHFIQYTLLSHAIDEVDDRLDCF